MSVSPLWEEIFSTRAWGKYPPEEFIRFMAANFYRRQPRSGVRVFEAGFGTGANLWYAAREGFTIAGIEGAQAGVDVACARLDAEVPGWRAQGGDLRAGDMCAPLPWADATFDAVLDSDAATCNGFDEAVGIYRELHRVAKPGGRLYVRTPAAGTWGEGTGIGHGHGQWECAEGPFAGTGVVRFTAEDEIPQLLGDWNLVQLELSVRTMENRRREVREWVISALKD